MTHPTDNGPALKPSDEARRLVEELRKRASTFGGKHIALSTEDRELDRRAAAYIEATPQNAEEANVGWLYACDNAGCEFSPQHPVESGETPEATNIRPATAGNLLAELKEAWSGAPTKAAEAFSQAYYLICGRSPQWSKEFGYKQALADIDDAQRLLRGAARQNAGEAKPVAWRWQRPKWTSDDWQFEAKDPTSTRTGEIVVEPLYRAAPPHADLVAENARLRDALTEIVRRDQHLRYTGDEPGPIDGPHAIRARAALTNGGKNARSDAGEAGE